MIGKALFRAPLAELTPGMIVGESTPSYLFYGEPVGIALCPPFNQRKALAKWYISYTWRVSVCINRVSALFAAQVLRRIKALLPGVRLIVMLRNPVERAYSHYSMTAEKAADTPKVLADRRCVLLACHRVRQPPPGCSSDALYLCLCVSLCVSGLFLSGAEKWSRASRSRS